MKNQGKKSSEARRDCEEKRGGKESYTKDRERERESARRRDVSALRWRGSCASAGKAISVGLAGLLVSLLSSSARRGLFVSCCCFFACYFLLGYLFLFFYYFYFPTFFL
jgi:hypothetical protein